MKLYSECGLPVFDIELDRRAPVVFVERGLVDGADPGRSRFYEVEADGLDAPGAAHECQLEVSFSHHALSGDVEFVAEARRRKT